MKIHIDISGLTDCAQKHIEKINSLASKTLDRKYKLPCGCESAALKDLIYGYECSECGELYHYSFCWQEVVQSSETWHCNICGTCQDSGVWHCKSCNNCTYGLTLTCEYCGKKSPFMPE